jgi:cyclopropane fatty-acyl-phospholipid synthase-like methyltransferase
MIYRVLIEAFYLLGFTPWDTGVSPPELIRVLESRSPGRALDLGCGTGTNVINMAQLGWSAMGIDISHLAIRTARRKAVAAGLKVEFIQGDVTNIRDVEGSFDLALDIGCFHSLSTDGRYRYATNLESLVHAGGTYLLYSWLNPDRSIPKSVPTETDILRYFDKAFDLVDVEHGTERHRAASWFNFKRKN